MLEAGVFVAAASIALVAGLSMVLSKNAVHSALFLVGVQIALAILFLLQGAFFIAALQIIIYAGAIMVLFVFVVMLLGVDRMDALVEHLSFQRPLAIGLGLLLTAEALYLGVSDSIFTNIPAAAEGLQGSGGLQGSEGNVEGVARLLFTEYAFPFEVTSVLLVVAVIGVMVLAKRKVGAE
ncbi:MAG TPA: NADH-quinone oxidoreductase subunit J [Actinomycetota bacterium]|nr:NADH-quinone oxidoreductase subunit J [Actinomycetota bacterium]